MWEVCFLCICIDYVCPATVFFVLFGVWSFWPSLVSGLRVTFSCDITVQLATPSSTINSCFTKGKVIPPFLCAISQCGKDRARVHDMCTLLLVFWWVIPLMWPLHCVSTVTTPFFKVPLLERCLWNEIGYSFGCCMSSSGHAWWQKSPLSAPITDQSTCWFWYYPRMW